MGDRIPPFPHPARVTGIVGEVIEVTASPGGHVIVESTEGDDLLSVHLSTTEARWLAAMLLVEADTADREAAAKAAMKSGRFAHVTAEIEEGMRRAAAAASDNLQGDAA